MPRSCPRSAAAPVGSALGCVLFGLLALAAEWGQANAMEITVSAGGSALADAVAAATPGDRLVLQPGDHRGGLSVEQPMAITGQAGARVVGPGRGHVLRLDAPGILVEGLEITGSGLKLESEDAGVFVTAKAKGAMVANNRIVGNLIGVYLKGAANAVVRNNEIVGRQDLRLNERGNGVHIWNAPGAIVEGNNIRHGRDGIFVTTSKDNIFRDNTLSDLRFAVHYMYTNFSQVIGNRSIGNHVGYAIMYSRGLTVAENRSEGDRDHGILLNYANRSQIAGNVVVDSSDRDGPEKCVFIYNANKNAISENRFQGCAIGIHFTAGSERNDILGNAFVDNRQQVKYVGTRHIDWSRDGQGNYWSDNVAFDLDADGVADRPYRPNDMVDQIVWRHPLAKLLLNSPALQVLRWAQSAFPSLYPGGVEDSHPLMLPPVRGTADG